MSSTAADRIGSEAKVTDPRSRGLLARLLSLNAAAMLGRNTVVSCCTFAFGLVVLWLLVEQLEFAKVPSAAISFLLATTLHYGFGRTWIFRGTNRALAPGYVYFLINAGIGLVVTTALFAAMVEFTSINYLAVRVVVSLVAGLVMFLLNAISNFCRL